MQIWLVSGAQRACMKGKGRGPLQSLALCSGACHWLLGNSSCFDSTRSELRKKLLGPRLFFKMKSYLNQIRWNPCSQRHREHQRAFLATAPPSQDVPNPTIVPPDFPRSTAASEACSAYWGHEGCKNLSACIFLIIFVYLPSALHFRRPTVFHFVGCVLADSATKSKAVAAAFGWKKVAWQGVASNNSVVPLFGKYFLWDFWSFVRTIREYALLVIRTRTGNFSVLNTSAPPSFTSEGW